MTTGSGLKIRRGEDLSLSGEALGAILADVLGKDLPFRFKARGFSMSPFLKDGDVITVSPLRGREPRTGDIVAFLHPKTRRIAVHRIVRKASGTILLKGDNSPGPDDPLPIEAVLGIVTGAERAGRSVRLGGGPLRTALAAFSRAGLLAPLLRWARGAVGKGRRGS